MTDDKEPKSENAERTCRAGHTYVTEATSPGRCWCGELTALEAVPDELASEVVEGLSPGVRELVVWLNGQGFRTVDSGDGSNHAHGMGCAVPFPMVAILSAPERLLDEARRLYRLLADRGVQFDLEARGYTCDPPEEANWPKVEASYDPHDGSAVITVYNVLSRDAKL